MQLKNLEIGEKVVLRNGTISVQNNIPKLWELSKDNDQQVVYYFGGGIAVCPIGKIAVKNSRCAGDVEVYGEYTVNPKGFVVFTINENGTHTFTSRTYVSRMSFVTKEVAVRHNADNGSILAGSYGNILWSIRPRVSIPK